jgi:hypothetical protein
MVYCQKGRGLTYLLVFRNTLSRVIWDPDKIQMEHKVIQIRKAILLFDERNHAMISMCNFYFNTELTEPVPEK